MIDCFEAFASQCIKEDMNMKHRIDHQNDGARYIQVEDGEDARDVLRAIVIASFETASPIELGQLHFNSDQEMTPENADSFISLPPEYGNVVVNMDYVQGRMCKTTITQESEKLFTLDINWYERDRGVPEPMLDRAARILVLNSRDIPLDSSSVSKVKTRSYKGENLELRLKECGFERGDGENDWGFRKRIFPDLYLKNPEMAMNFLFGANTSEWGEFDNFLYLAFLMENDTSYKNLKKFAEGFAADPMEMR